MRFLEADIHEYRHGTVANHLPNRRVKYSYIGYLNKMNILALSRGASLTRACSSAPLETICTV